MRTARAAALEAPDEAAEREPAATSGSARGPAVLLPKAKDGTGGFHARKRRRARFWGGLWSQHETLSRGAWGGAGSDAEELLDRSREDAGLAWGDGRSDGERGHSGSRVERVWSHGE